MLISGDPAFLVGEISAEFDVTREGARYRMNRMVEDGLLEKKKPGDHIVIYWPTERGLAYFAEHTTTE
jgi:predicted transcriptional regulator